MSWTACGGDEDAAGPTTTEATTTTERETTTTVSGCDEAVEDAVDALGTLLDRVEADPESALEANDDAGDILTELGEQVGQECGSTAGGPAVSEIVVYLAGEASDRPGQAGEYAGGVLSGLCTSIGDSVELTARGQTACLGTGDDTASGDGSVTFEGVVLSTAVNASATGTIECSDGGEGISIFDLNATEWTGEGAEALNGYSLRALNGPGTLKSFKFFPPASGGVEMFAALGIGAGGDATVAPDLSSITFERVEIEDDSGFSLGYLSGEIACD